MALQKRKPNRIPGFDYSTPGAYFVTICTNKRKNTLCSIVGDGFPVPKAPGQIVEGLIQKVPEKHPEVRIDKYVIMPNYIHMLLQIAETPGTGNPSPTLGNVIGWFKYRATKEVNVRAGAAGERFFQRSYHDHVVRNERDYQKIWQYIDTNPAKWAEDCFYNED